MKLPSPLQPLPASAYSLFVGVDSAARTAVAAWIVPGEPVTRPITIEQSPIGFASLQDQLLATGGAPANRLIVLEATGTRLSQAGDDPEAIGLHCERHHPHASP